MKRPRMLQLANAVMFVLFVSWALFQYNDPDALAWILVYGTGALCCVLFHVRRLSPLFGAAVVVVGLVWALVLGYFVLTADEPYSFVDDNIGEMAREALGLVIVAGWTGFLARRSALEKRQGSKDDGS